MTEHDDRRETLVQFLEQRAFDPVLSASTDDYQSDEDKHRLANVKRSTLHEKHRYRDWYRTAEAVRANYLSDLSSPAGQKKTRELEALGLPTLASIEDEFLAKCDELHVKPS